MQLLVAKYRWRVIPYEEGNPPPCPPIHLSPPPSVPFSLSPPPSVPSSLRHHHLPTYLPFPRIEIYFPLPFQPDNLPPSLTALVCYLIRLSFSPFYDYYPTTYHFSALTNQTCIDQGITNDVWIHGDAVDRWDNPDEPLYSNDYFQPVSAVREHFKVSY